MSGSEMKKLDYPRKSPGKTYFTFMIASFEDNNESKSINVDDILNSLPNHTKGAPVFIEPNQIY